MLPDINEALRYLGAGSRPPEELRQQAAQVAEELAAQVQPRCTYRLFPLVREEGSFRLDGTNLLLSGHTAKRMLAQCGQAVLMACTLGAKFDTMVRSAQARDMARAVILDACGSALVEKGCDEAERDIAVRFPGLYLTDRFSPGYGARPLRRAGRRTPGGNPRDIQLSDESQQVRHRRHRPFGQAPDGPHPGLRLVRHAGDLHTSQGRKNLWPLIFLTPAGSFGFWTVPWAPSCSSGVSPPAASRSC